MTASRFLFVAGIARSGTSALTQLLNAHPSVVLGMERYFNLSKDGRSHELVPELFEPARFLAPTPEETHNHSWGRDGPYRQHLTRKLATAEIIGDKVPNYFLYADHLLATFPRSRMLLITREPLHVADSWKRRRLDPDDLVWDAGAEEGLRQWNTGHVTMLEVARRHFGRVGVVVYEHIFSGDRAAFGRLLSWLDAGPITGWTMRNHAKETKGWTDRVARDFVIDGEERRMVEERADLSTRRELIDEFGI